MATIRKRGKKWQVQVRRVGHKAVTKTFLVRKDAETWARQIEIQVDRKDLPKDPRELERYTLRDLINRYCETVSPLKRGYYAEKMRLKAIARRPVGQKRVSDITTEDFARYRDDRLLLVSPHTVKREFATLHHLFETAKREWGLPLKSNPLSDVTLSCPCNRRQRRLGEGELELITQAARKTKNPTVLPIILFALETGLRRSDIIGARWSHFDTEKRLLSLPRPKNGHSRSVPLSSCAIEILTSLKQATGQQTTSNEQIFRTTINAFRLAWQKLIRRSGIKDLRFHDFRHEAISRFFELGMTIPEVAVLSGHRDTRMLLRYGHAQQNRILRILDKWEIGASRLC